METHSFIEAESKVCAHNYLPIPVVLKKGQDIWLWDIENKKYLDMMSAYSAVSHGHCHPELIACLEEQAKTLCISSRAFYTNTLTPFLEKLCQMADMDMALPMNTGAEAVETAIKAVRRWGYQVKGIPDNQAEIIVCSDNFHGRTTTIISFSSDEAYKKDFGPFTPGFKIIPYGDIHALEKAITPNTCAFLVEPIQGEAGIKMPPEGWLKSVSTLCQEKQVLLVLDEIQSGLGRTGKLFAYEHEGIKPDGLILGKALGGGILPVSAFLANTPIMSCFEPGSHGSTFGGNPLSSKVALKALELLERDQLVENSAQLGDYLINALKKIQSPILSGVHGKGLWVGVDINPDICTARLVCETLMKYGVLSKETHETVVRFAPPLTITQADLDWAIKQFKLTLQDIERGL